MSNTPEIVALTGASGSLGAVVLDLLLEQGHHVNAIVRSFAKTKSFLEAFYPKATSSGQLQFTEVPDMTVAGCFDSVLASADKLIHVATPLAYDDFEEKDFKPSEAVMDNVLTAAKKSSKVRRVIVTGSIVAVLQLPKDLIYSKVAAELQAWKFMEKQKPRFDLIFMLVPAITGRSIQQGWRSNRATLGGISGIYRALFDVEQPSPVFPYFQDIDYVAAVHIKSLDTATVPGNKRYLTSAGYMDSNYLARKVREEFPELKDRVPEGPGDSPPSADLVKLNIEETNKVFGTQWKGAWESARETIKDIVETEKKYGIQEPSKELDPAKL